MLFSPDIRASLIATAALVNTLPRLSRSRSDELATPEQLAVFLVRHPFSGIRTRLSDEHDSVRSARTPLHELWLSEDETDLVSQINLLLRDGGALPQLVRHDDFGWHVHAASDGFGLAERILVEGALAWTEVVRADEQRRMRQCAGADCEAVLVDLSRNRTKLYCDSGNCGNRAHVAAYRRRTTAS